MGSSQRPGLGHALTSRNLQTWAVRSLRSRRGDLLGKISLSIATKRGSDGSSRDAQCHRSPPPLGSRAARRDCRHSIAELAAAEKINQSYGCRVLRLTLLAPALVEAILDGRQPSRLQLRMLLNPFPSDWTAQAHYFA